MSGSRDIAALALCASLALGGIGCNDSPEMAPVRGVLTYAGEPIAQGSVQFYPIQPGPMAAGVLSSDGSFQLTTKRPGDGAIVGEYTVVVTPPSSVNELEKELKPGRPRTKTFDSIPLEVRNQTTSTLRASVKSGDNSIELDLSEELAR